MKFEIEKQLQSFAFRNSKPFCYTCYEEASSGKCHRCGSDDLMRLIPGVGCEWGIDWVIRHLIEEKLAPVDTDEEFEESVRQCYPEDVKVGWMTLDSVSVMKEMDPVSWDFARSEWESQEEDDGSLISFDHGATFYRRYDIQEMIATDTAEQVLGGSHAN